MVSLELVGKYQVMAVDVCFDREREVKMPRPKAVIPVPRLHKPSGQARVYLNK